MMIVTDNNSRPDVTGSAVAGVALLLLGGRPVEAVTVVG